MMTDTPSPEPASARPDVSGGFRLAGWLGNFAALAPDLRLAAHRMVAEKVGSAPVLVLDDVLSELDPRRCAALLHHLPPGQVVLTTAGVLPDAAQVMALQEEMHAVRLASEANHYRP